MRWEISFVSSLLLCVCLGCSGEKGLSGLAEVTGLFTYQGKPVEGATVGFVPEGEGRAASGLTGTDGRFALTTLKTRDGAMPGRYKVTISKIENMGPESQITAEEMAQMVAGGQSAPRGPTGGGPGKGMGKPGEMKHHVPEKYAKVETSGLAADVSASGPNDFEFALE